ncbi:MAG: hypothetical protein HY296_01045 [Thaumarchaeota archaeon]|nr:hypothetical protein [Nitrososphaerota archaeon]
MSSDQNLSVSVSYGDSRVEFSGPPEVVMRSLHEFVSKVVPNMDLARAISVNFSLNDLVQMFRDYVRVTPEGPRVWTQDKKLSDRDVIVLQLVAARISLLSAKASSDALSVSEVEATTGLNPKTISSRLSELTKSAQVERVAGEGGGRYRVSTLGVSRLSELLTKKLKPA